MTQAEIYLFLDPRPVAEEKIAAMVHEAICETAPAFGASSIGKLPDEELAAVDELIAVLEKLADDALAGGLMSLPSRIREHDLDPPVAEALAAVSAGVSLEEPAVRWEAALGDGLLSAEQRRFALGLYGAFAIAHGYQGFVLRICLERLAAGVLPGSGPDG